MKVLALILSVITATTLLVGGNLLVAATREGEPSAGSVLANASLTVFIYGPLVLGSLSAYWDVRGSGESRATFRRWLLVIIGLEVLAGVAIVLYSVLQPAPMWLPPLFIGAGVFLTAVALIVGPMIYRNDAARRVPVEAWSTISRKEVRRKIAIVAITFGVTIVLASALAALLFATNGGDDPADAFGEYGILVLSVAFYAAAAACIFSTLRWNRRVRESFDGDLGKVRRVAKFVLRRKGERPKGDDEVNAVRYAATIPVILGFQLAWIVLLYIGLGLQQVQLLSLGSAQPLLLWMPVLLGVILLVVVPITLRQIVMARRYSHEHAHILEETSA